MDPSGDVDDSSSESDGGVTAVEVYGFVGYVSSAVGYGARARRVERERWRSGKSGSSGAPQPRSSHRLPCDPASHPSELALLCPFHPPGPVAYLAWALIPDRYLDAMGVTYRPSKYWAVAVPTWACVALFVAASAYEW